MGVIVTIHSTLCVFIGGRKKSVSEEEVSIPGVDRSGGNHKPLPKLPMLTEDVAPSQCKSNFPKMAEIVSIFFKPKKQ